MVNIYNEDTALGVVLACSRNYTALKITTISLDGSPYIQTPGEAADRRTVYVYCDTYEKRNLLDDASNTGAVLTWEWLGSTLKGYIERDVRWKESKDGSGVGEITVIVREVIE